MHDSQASKAEIHRGFTSRPWLACGSVLDRSSRTLELPRSLTLPINPIVSISLGTVRTGDGKGLAVATPTQILK
jgi:hypothetical protein